MFRSRQQQAETERQLQELRRQTEALAQSAEALQQRCSALQNNYEAAQGQIEELSARCATLESEQTFADAAIEDVRFDLRAMAALLDAESPGCAWARELRLGLKTLSRRIDWEAEQAQQTATALLEQIRLSRPSDGARAPAHAEANATRAPLRLDPWAPRDDTP